MRSDIYDFTLDRTFVKRFDTTPLMRFKPLDIIRRHKPLFAPGGRTSYADSNYVLLGIILEKVTHRPAESVITTNIIRRLRLRHTSFPTTAAMPIPFSHGYYAGDDGNGPIRDYTAVNPKIAWTAGGMVSTMGDLLTWGKALATGTLLSHRLQAQRLQFGAIPTTTVRRWATASGSCDSARGSATTARSSASAPSPSMTAPTALRSSQQPTSRQTPQHPPPPCSH
jgi:D-alanyl-D-alanine carboxypeptidase